MVLEYCFLLRISKSKQACSARPDGYTCTQTAKKQSDLYLHCLSFNQHRICISRGKDPNGLTGLNFRIYNYDKGVTFV